MNGLARSRPDDETGRYTSSVVSRLTELRRLTSAPLRTRTGVTSAPMTSAAPPPSTESTGVTTMAAATPNRRTMALLRKICTTRAMTFTAA